MRSLFAARRPFEIVSAVVRLDAVLVIDRFLSCGIGHERFRHQPMNGERPPFAPIRKRAFKIAVPVERGRDDFASSVVLSAVAPDVRVRQ